MRAADGYTTKTMAEYRDSEIAASVAKDQFAQETWRRATDRLFNRLRQHHPDGDPNAKRGFYLKSVTPPIVQPPPPPAKVVVTKAQQDTPQPVACNDLLVAEPCEHPEIVEIVETESRLTMRRIQDVTCDHFGVLRSDILSTRRTAPLVRARHVAVYLCKTQVSRSLPEIGRAFGNRDHTTILHAIRKVKSKIADHQEDINAIKARLA